MIFFSSPLRDAKDGVRGRRCSAPPAWTTGTPGGAQWEEARGQAGSPPPPRPAGADPAAREGQPRGQGPGTPIHSPERPPLWVDAGNPGSEDKAEFGYPETGWGGASPGTWALRLGSLGSWPERCLARQPSQGSWLQPGQMPGPRRVWGRATQQGSFPQPRPSPPYLPLACRKWKLRAPGSSPPSSPSPTLPLFAPTLSLPLTSLPPPQAGAAGTRGATSF